MAPSPDSCRFLQAIIAHLERYGTDPATGRPLSKEVTVKRNAKSLIDSRRP